MCKNGINHDLCITPLALGGPSSLAAMLVACLAPSNTLASQVDLFVTGAVCTKHQSLSVTPRALGGTITRASFADMLRALWIIGRTSRSGVVVSYLWLGRKTPVWGECLLRSLLLTEILFGTSPGRSRRVRGFRAPAVLLPSRRVDVHFPGGTSVSKGSRLSFIRRSWTILQQE
jgi:hypothetical protein